MKFTEEKLEQAFTELISVKIMSNFPHQKLEDSKMSSFYANKLDIYVGINCLLNLMNTLTIKHFLFHLNSEISFSLPKITI